MTWTYSESEASDRNKVRGKIGDTDTARQLLADETLDTILTSYPSVVSAALEAAKRIVAKLARDVDRSAIGMSSSRSQVVQHYKDLIVELRAEVGTDAEMWGGVTSIAEKESLEDDSDFAPPAISVGMDDIV